MQSNTAVVENQDINRARISVENRKSDPFTIVDGQHIGHDWRREISAKNPNTGSGRFSAWDFQEFCHTFVTHLR
jgi:hypothetical protein